MSRLPARTTAWVHAGGLAGIVSRADIMQAFVRSDEDITDHVRTDVVERILMIDADRVRIDVTDGVVRLSGTVPTRTDARLLEELTARVEGVVRVDSEVSFELDDTVTPESPEPNA